MFGFAMVLIMIWRPRGLVATRDPSSSCTSAGQSPPRSSAEGRG